jgi:hypothetical protein
VSNRANQSRLTRIENVGSCNEMSTQLQTKAAQQPSFAPVPTGFLQRKCACGQHSIAGGECEECRQKREGTLQRAAVNTAPVNGVPSIVHDVLNSPGQPLDAGTRAFMEPRFGQDFSNVRVHTGTKAAESALAVNALAYTVGRDVVFGEGTYKPKTSEGMRLLAHELVHVVQQTRSTGAAMQKVAILQVSEPDDVFEAEALTQATMIIDGEAARPIERQINGNLLQRATIFHPGVAHNHKPTHNWPAIARESERKCGTSSEKSAIECVCAHTSAREALEAARFVMITLRGLTLADQHLDHYLYGGGADYKEDLEAVIRQDEKVRAVLQAAIKKQGRRGHVRIEQDNYANEDFKFAFGAIDRLDFEVIGGTKKGATATTAQVHVWFKDRYEWHPEDTRRPSNCVHKAAVELKDEGAQDYWMVGEATVPLGWITSPGGLLSLESEPL